MAIRFNDKIMEPVSSDSLPRINVLHISLEKLKPFANHPFKPYTGQQLKDLVQSVQENGF